MDKIIIKDSSSLADNFSSELSKAGEYGIFSIQDKGIEAKSVIFVITESKGGISKEVRLALESLKISNIVGYIAVIVLYEKRKVVSHIEAERALAKAGIAASYIEALKTPFTKEDVVRISNDIEKEEIKLPYRFPFSKAIGRITKGLNKWVFLIKL